jgi:hypothetical protein
MKPLTCFAACAAPAMLLAIGCGSDLGIIDPASLGEGAGPSFATENYSDWSDPINLGPSVNSAATENTPTLSKDGLSLYFGSPRAGGSGSNDLWVAHRACSDSSNPECAWQDAVNLGPVVNSNAIEAGPELARDGHRLLFTSGRSGGFGSNDIYLSQRPCTRADDPVCAWGSPVNLGPAINTSEFEGGPSLRGPELYFNRGNVAGAPQVGTSVSDIYVSRMDDDGFGLPIPVDNLNSPAVDQRPSVRFDGREIFLASDRSGGLGSHDIWTSTRPSNDDSWGIPVNLGPAINTEFEENHPSLSADGTMLFFASRRPSPGEACGLPPQPACDLDLYVATRMRVAKS